MAADGSYRFMWSPGADYNALVGRPLCKRCGEYGGLPKEWDIQRKQTHLGSKIQERDAAGKEERSYGTVAAAVDEKLRQHHALAQQQAAAVATRGHVQRIEEAVRRQLTSWEWDKNLPALNPAPQPAAAPPLSDMARIKERIREEPSLTYEAFCSAIETRLKPLLPAWCKLVTDKTTPKPHAGVGRFLLLVLDGNGEVLLEAPATRIPSQQDCSTMAGEIASRLLVLERERVKALNAPRVPDPPYRFDIDAYIKG
jgi:hypothetical protein